MSLNIKFYQGLDKRLAMLVIEVVIAALVEAEWVIFSSFIMALNTAQAAMKGKIFE